jgi:hypothetical protein
LQEGAIDVIPVFKMRNSTATLVNTPVLFQAVQAIPVHACFFVNKDFSSFMLFNDGAIPQGGTMANPPGGCIAPL